MMPADLSELNGGAGGNHVEKCQGGLQVIRRFCAQVVYAYMYMYL